MKKKVCIMTSEESFINNYGAALQGYALFTTIKTLEYTPQIVRYNGGMIPRWCDVSFAHKLHIIASRIYHFIFQTESKREQKKLLHKYRNQIKNRELYFEKFQKDNIVFQNENRVGWYDLRDNPPQSDIYLCGSDQIWNPYFKGGNNDLGYFLDFAPKGKPRIAYAPSLGCSELPEKAKSNIKELLNKFSAISVREQDGKKIISDETGLDVDIVADPTLLLTKDEWDYIEKLPTGIPEKYILCYRFSDNNDTKKQIDNISATTGLPIITLPLSVPSYRDEYIKIFDAGPAEFIGLIKNAKLVCTDSFHATVFSLIYGTPFYVFLRENFEGAKANMNSRVNNLLNLAKLESRLISCDDKIEKEEIFKVDFSKFEDNVKEFRMESKEWLKTALKGEPK